MSISSTTHFGDKSFWNTRDIQQIDTDRDVGRSDHVKNKADGRPNRLPAAERQIQVIYIYEYFIAFGSKLLFN